MILTNLFWFLEKVFILMNIRINKKSLTKYHCLKRRIFSKLYMEDVTDLDYNPAKRFCKAFETNR